MAFDVSFSVSGNRGVFDRYPNRAVLVHSHRGIAQTLSIWPVRTDQRCCGALVGWRGRHIWVGSGELSRRMGRRMDFWVSCDYDPELSQREGTNRSKKAAVIAVIHLLGILCNPLIDSGLGAMKDMQISILTISM